MADLLIKRADPVEAGRELEAAIRETITGAVVAMRTVGQAQQPSILSSVGHELGGYFRTTEPTMFSVIADTSSPRPLKIRAQYVAVARGAGPVSIVYLARLRYVVPHRVEFDKGRFRSGGFSGEPQIAAALSAANGLASILWRLLQPKVVFGTTIYTIEPKAALIPGDAGAILGVLAAPARNALGLGSYRLDLNAFLEIADQVERAIAPVSSVTSAPAPDEAIPD